MTRSPAASPAKPASPSKSEAPDLLALDRQVCFALAVASRNVIALYRPLLEPMGLTHPQYLVMLALWEESPLKVSELAQRLSLEPATLSPLLKRLEAGGMITRGRDPRDDRALAITLTTQGRRARRQAERIPPAIMARLGMGLPELEGLRDGLNRLIDAAAREEPAMATTHHLTTPDVTLAYDVHGPLPTVDGRPPLFMVGAPMGAEGFTTLATLFADRTVVTYDVRGLGRSERTDDSLVQTPEQNATDQHAVIAALGVGPVEMFASSGGAVSALALIAAHPEDVTTVVAHEPPLLTVLPDADAAFAAERAVQAAYQERGQGAGMAAFIGLTSWSGEFTPEYAAQPAPDPAQFGMPSEDDGNRDDPLLSGVSDTITAYRPDLEALRSASTRLVLAAGIQSAGTITARTTEALAKALGQDVVVFPSHHGGFMGGEHGYGGEPEAFAATLREVLGS